MVPGSTVPATRSRSVAAGRAGADRLLSSPRRGEYPKFRSMFRTVPDLGQDPGPVWSRLVPSLVPIGPTVHTSIDPWATFHGLSSQVSGRIQIHYLQRC
jgi:hypothetical protein